MGVILNPYVRLYALIRSKSDVIKWMFIFWVGQIVVLSAILFAFLKTLFSPIIEKAVLQ